MGTLFKLSVTNIFILCNGPTSLKYFLPVYNNTVSDCQNKLVPFQYYNVDNRYKIGYFSKGNWDVTYMLHKSYENFSKK